MRGFPFSVPVLCLIVSPSTPRLYEKVEEAVSAGVNMLQLRGHGCAASEIYEAAVRLRAISHRYDALFVVNDRIDVGLAVDADGFQLGKHSLPLLPARQLVGEARLLGASVHSCEEALHVVEQGADFVLAGTIFPSASHPGEHGQGTELLHTLKATALQVPVLAIGGITAENARLVREAGADGVAVISAIVEAQDTGRAVRELWAALQEDKGGVSER